jgi:hypothetical protein
MTKFNLSQIKPIPGFDSLKWKREVQAKIYEETKHMTFEERREYSRKSSEQLRQEREQYQAEIAAQNN